MFSALLKFVTWCECECEVGPVVEDVQRSGSTSPLIFNLGSTGAPPKGGGGGLPGSSPSPQIEILEERRFLET